MRQVTVGSRGSDLARAMVEEALRKLRATFPKTEFRHRIVTTAGDRDRRTSLSVLGGDYGGLFAKQLEVELESGGIDVAMHSLKDLPTRLPPGLVLAAIPNREDPRDALCGARMADLAVGARVGTGSPRRRSQLLHVRPDLNIVDVRGNVVPRIARLKATSSLSAIVLAAAGRSPCPRRGDRGTSPATRARRRVQPAARCLRRAHRFSLASPLPADLSRRSDQHVYRENRSGGSPRATRSRGGKRHPLLGRRQHPPGDRSDASYRHARLDVYVEPTERSLPLWQIAHVVVEDLTRPPSADARLLRLLWGIPRGLRSVENGAGPHRRPRPYTLLPTGSRAFAVHHCGARIRNTHCPLPMQLVDWQRVGDALRSDLAPRGPG